MEITILAYLCCKSFNCEASLRIKEGIKNYNLLDFLIENFMNYKVNFISLKMDFKFLNENSNIANEEI